MNEITKIYCKFCDNIKNKAIFSNSQIKRKNPKCRDCVSSYDKIYHINNKSKRNDKSKKHYKENKEDYKINNKKYYKNNEKEIKKYLKNYYIENKKNILKNANSYYKLHKIEKLEYQKQYNKKNRYKINEYFKKHNKYRRKVDVFFRLRSNISGAIYFALKKQKSSKNNISIMKHLPFSIEELKQHLENQFEPWMTWENHGRYYIKKWNNNDQSTWTWQIDHIIPQSNLPYTSMEDDNFKICWSLNNLRPLRSDLNFKKGSNMIEKDFIS